jgi:hypothetical protein
MRLPDIAATIAGFMTAIWMGVQIWLAIARFRNSHGCARKDCARRK